MKKLKSILLIGLTIATIGIVTGCSNNNDNKTSSKEETRIVQSVKGEMEIPKNPQRIVDISGSSEELVLLGHTPIATANVDSYETDKVPSCIEEKLGNAKVVGHSMMDTMDIEAILSAEPDLIIMAPRQEKIYDQLKEIAPVVMLEDKSNDWEAKFKDVANLFGQEEEAQKWLDNYYDKAKKLGDEIKSTNGEKTYLTVLASSGQFMVFTEGGIGTVLKDDMGLPQPDNMPAQDGITLPIVSMEGLTEINADHIILIATESDKADLEKNTVWKEMRAFKEGDVTILDASPYFSQAYNPIGRELLLQSIKDEVVK
ncbi:iron-hydroxamate ABC transporter substrate-binding protein [Clostridium botulinum]|uniref:iron-hydroxamate ABC transporter substrate-binding protein n=1 Tax=unclassified Clostridium TaxID=2614128 RepID=UPI0013C75763|nr:MULTISPECIES: iron-hydroxamate ABC transporter substrate-binding protein [unclassified Clostridium]MBY7008625.1 iron-hydroxamate ABC transporter substrate-binding protein [Clostridium botulinum]NFH73250.1 iron-hydroxamate ABC transporter substrate-binding protein [Clostridium botulinum]NFI01456.1 iron-hydroxamate ABC transporter substrate-binding protein [Clostridium botulinum]NFI63994.1 iron-hydroxamate ABC transporter substrate-binding protein [Clostridium botulinum]NFI81587.1 iron-hydrox